MAPESNMWKCDWLVIFIALGTAICGVTSVLTMPMGMMMADEMATTMRMELTEFLEDPIGIAGLCLFTLFSIPMVYSMSRVKARFFSGQWRVPAETYALPRWVIRISLGGLIGQAAGFLVLAAIHDMRYLWYFGMLTLLSLVFYLGAGGRLKTHPGTEFNMHYLPGLWAFRALFTHRPDDSEEPEGFENTSSDDH